MTGYASPMSEKTRAPKGRIPVDDDILTRLRRASEIRKVPMYILANRAIKTWLDRLKFNRK